MQSGRIADVVAGRPTMEAPRITLPDGLLLPGFVNLRVRLGVGIDGVGLDMVAELRAAAILAKIQAVRSGIASTEDMLRAATINGAQAIGRADLGTLAIGATADLCFSICPARATSRCGTRCRRCSPIACR